MTRADVTHEHSSNGNAPASSSEAKQKNHQHRRPRQWSGNRVPKLDVLMQVESEDQVNGSVPFAPATATVAGSATAGDDRSPRENDEAMPETSLISSDSPLSRREEAVSSQQRSPWPWSRRQNGNHLTNGAQEEEMKIIEEIRESLDQAARDLVQSLYRHLHNGAAGGLTLPAAAAAWLSSNQLGNRRMDLLRPRVSHVRLTATAWPTAPSSKYNRQRWRRVLASSSTTAPAVRTVVDLALRPEICLSHCFPACRVLWLDGVSMSWMKDLQKLPLQVLRVESTSGITLRAVMALGVGPKSTDDNEDYEADWRLTLTHVKISRCELRDESSAADAVDLPALRSLNLSHNEIKSTRGLCGLHKTPFLSRLDLSHNRVQSLRSLHYRATHLQTLVLSHNRMTSVEGIDRLFSLQTLLIDNNCLADMSKISGLARLPELSEIRLAGNPVTRVRSFRVTFLDWFRDKRAPRLARDATLRDLRNILPAIDGHPANVTELRDLKRRQPPPTTLTRPLTAEGTDDEAKNNEDEALVIDVSVESGISERSLGGTTICPTRPRRPRARARRVQVDAPRVEIASARSTDSRVAVEFSLVDVLRDTLPERHVVTETEKQSSEDREETQIVPDDDVLKPCDELEADAINTADGKADVDISVVVADPSHQIHRPNLSADVAESSTELQPSPPRAPTATECSENGSVFSPRSSTPRLHDTEHSNPEGNNESKSPTSEPSERAFQWPESIVGKPDSEIAAAGSEKRMDKEEMYEDEEDQVTGIADGSARLPEDPPSADALPPTVDSNNDENNAQSLVELNLSPIKKETEARIKSDLDKSDSKEAEEDTKHGARDPLSSSLQNYQSFSTDDGTTDKMITLGQFPELLQTTDDLWSVQSSVSRPLQETTSYFDMESQTQYDGPENCRMVKVHDDLELYFDTFVFGGDQESASTSYDKSNVSIDSDVTRNVPRVQLLSIDHVLRDTSAAGSKKESFRRLWKDRVVACGEPALRRLTPSTGARYGFHGELLWSDSNTSHLKAETVVESRDILVCFSSTSLYLILDHDKVSQKLESKRRKFPRPLPKDALFKDGLWPHALARHPFSSLQSITIGFGFQRLTLRFGQDRKPSPSDFVYVLLTCNKTRTVTVLKDLQDLVEESTQSGDMFADPIQSTLVIDNDDPQVLDALGQAVAPDLVGVVLHYQVLGQRWNKGDRGVVRRVFVVTDTKLLLFDEDYVGDGSGIIKNNGRFGDAVYRLVDTAPLSMVTEVQASNTDTEAITVVVKPQTSFQRTRNWRLTCRDRVGADRLVEDLRRALTL